jgi:hypothetical protein
MVYMETIYSMQSVNKAFTIYPAYLVHFFTLLLFLYIYVICA